MNIHAESRGVDRDIALPPSMLTIGGDPVIGATLIATYWAEVSGRPGQEHLRGREYLHGLVTAPCPYCRDARGFPIRHVHGVLLGNGVTNPGTDWAATLVLQWRRAHCVDGDRYRGGYYVWVPDKNEIADPSIAAVRPLRKGDRSGFPDQLFRRLNQTATRGAK